MYIDDLFSTGEYKNKNNPHNYILIPERECIKVQLDKLNLRFILNSNRDLVTVETYSKDTNRFSTLLYISSVGACCGSVVLNSLVTDSRHNLSEYGGIQVFVDLDPKVVLNTVMDIVERCGYTNVVYYCAEWQTDVKKLLVDYGFKPINKFYNNRSGSEVELLCFDFPKTKNEEDEEDEDY